MIDNNKKRILIISAIAEYLNAEQVKILGNVEQSKSQPVIKQSSKLNLWKRVIRSSYLDHVTTSKNHRHNIQRRSSKFISY